MEEAISTKENSFTCSVCLNLLKDPVAIACGHNFCMNCIKGCWDEEDQKGVYSCPLCKLTFTPRPVLSKNCLIAEMVEKFTKTRIQAPAQCYAGPGDVECDVCTGRKLKAVKSCLECLVSYCESHLKIHNEAHPRKHSVIDVTGQLQERICAQHKKPLEMFCRTDERFVCFLCKMYEHKSHDTVTAEEERTEKQKHLGETQQKFHKRLQEREKELQELKKAVETLKSSAQTAVEDSERIFTEIIRSIEKRRSEVTELIRAQEKAEVSWAEGLLKQLEQEIAELKRRDAELEQLSHTDDHMHFLLHVQSGNLSPQSKNLSSMTFNQRFSFEAVKESVSAFKMQLEEKLDFLHSHQVQEISAAVAKVQIIQSSTYTDPETQITRTDTTLQLPSDKRKRRVSFSTEAVINFPTSRLFRSPTSLSPVPRIRGDFSPLSRSPTSLATGPRTREEFLGYLCTLTLDENTANRNLLLSAGNRMVEGKDKMLSYPDHPERFDNWAQVLCREGVSGRCYWEIEWSGTVDIAVSYKSISRKGQGDDSRFGWNRCSWKLCCSSSRSLFKHNNKEYNLCLVRIPRIGVYVDHRGGTLAFYSISDTITLLHRVQTTFAHTLYPGFWVSEGSSVKLL